MSLYNLLFGMNAQGNLLLAVIGLRKHDVERFRDCHASPDGAVIEVYSRTGGGNRSGYPNLLMRKRPEWQGSEDDDFDSTYCTDRFAVPEEWREDVAKLGDVLAHGLRSVFAQHLAKTLRREPTDDDKAQALYDRERASIARLEGVMANGHTFVPYNDAAMEQALKLAEENGGGLRSCFGVLPLVLRVQTNFHPYPKAKPPLDQELRRFEVTADWKIDADYWEHCRQRFEEKYPLAIAKIASRIAGAKWS